MKYHEKTFSLKDLKAVDDKNDLHIAPFREDMRTTGTPTWIWSVVVNGDLYVRAYNGQASSWYQSAMKQGAGKIEVPDMTKMVRFEAVEEESINNRVDETYKAKYHDSPYLKPMISTWHCLLR